MVIVVLISILSLALLHILMIHRDHDAKLWYWSLLYGWLMFFLICMLWVTSPWWVTLEMDILPFMKASGGYSIVTGFAVTWLCYDNLSLLMILLSGFLMPLCILASKGSMKFLVKEFCLLLMVTEGILILVFSSSDLILFYIFFESTLMPLFMMIGVWGGRVEKVKAAFYFFLFTLAGSLFMLISIFKIMTFSGHSNMWLMNKVHLPIQWQNWCCLGLALGFAVKVPMFPVHMWLPQAHVEAPVAGSVLLAGIMLKLGGYGLIRFCWGLLPSGTAYMSPLFVVLSLLGVVYGGLTTCQQSDMKRLIAYSSVAHMGLVTCAIFNEDSLSQMGASYMMMAHGLVSSALFMLVTNLYSSTGSSLISNYRGVVISMPVFSSMFIMLNLSNMALPGSSNFLAEFMSMAGFFSESPLVTAMMALGVVISAIYSLLLMNSMCFGAVSPLSLNLSDLNSSEVFTAASFMLPAYQLGICSGWMISPLQSSFSL